MLRTVRQTLLSLLVCEVIPVIRFRVVGAAGLPNDGQRPGVGSAGGGDPAGAGPGRGRGAEGRRRGPRGALAPALRGRAHAGRCTASAPAEPSGGWYRSDFCVGRFEAFREVVT